MKRFKQFINEEASNQEFISFVEKVLTSNQIDTNQANDFLVNSFNYSGLLYKVIFCPLAEVQNFSEGGIPDTKAITDYIVKRFNTSRYVFFCKSLKGLENHIKYPGLFNIKEDQIGVIYSNKTAGSIDLTKYKDLGGNNIEVLKRIEETEPVLSFEDITINKIDGLYLFQDGWKFRTRLDQPIFSANDTDLTASVSGGEKSDLEKEDEVPDEDQTIKKHKLGGKPSSSKG